MSRAAAGVLVAVLCVAGCGRSGGETPEAVVESFARAVQASRSDNGARQRLFELLSTRARDALTERAQQASQLAGWELQPWEMFAPGRLRLRVDVDADRMASRIRGERAVVTVRGSNGGVADVPLVREDGQWRVDLVLPPSEAIRAGNADAGR